MKAESGGRRDVVESSRLCSQIVGSVTRFEVVVVRTAVEPEVSRSCGLAAVGVVGDLIGLQNIVAIVNFGVAVQFVDVAVFFLLVGADGGRIGILVRCLTSAGRARSGCLGFCFLFGFGGGRSCGLIGIF